jgi:prolyl-tRNA editing enzyme YbaK/EbsC (Cys-tRNA(Pro) deacylase)
VKGTENISRPVNQYQSAFFTHIALQFKKLAKKLAKILVAFIATNGISIAIAPLSKQLSVKTIVGQSGYSAAATNAQEQ